MKNVTMILAAGLLMSLSSFAQTPAAPAKGEDHAKMQAARDAVNSACSQDAATAGCGDAKYGSGLMRCLETYKKAHADFKVSDACKNAKGQLREDRKEVRADRKEKKKNH